jgi:hypothetical protein
MEKKFKVEYKSEHKYWNDIPRYASILIEAKDLEDASWFANKFEEAMKGVDLVNIDEVVSSEQTFKLVPFEKEDD